MFEEMRTQKRAKTAPCCSLQPLHYRVEDNTNWMGK